MPNPFAYAELHTQNPDAAKTFYRQLLDWRITDSETPAGVYTEIDPGEGFPAGMKKAAGAAVSSHWLPYMRVADVAASTSKAKQLGARAIQELVEIPEGRFSILVDPTGAPFGLWQKAAGA